LRSSVKEREVQPDPLRPHRRGAMAALLPAGPNRLRSCSGESRNVTPEVGASRGRGSRPYVRGGFRGPDRQCPGPRHGFDDHVAARCGS